MTGEWDSEAYAILTQVAGIESPDEQSAHLDEVCAGNQVLRQRVERLLSVYQQAGSFLDAPAIPASEGNVARPRNDTIGTRIGAYKILQEIGEGGFGVVYMAEQQWPVRRKVALKIIKPGMDNREVIARFEAEQQALAMMDHPNIARVLDAGTTDDGRPYFAMELVNGVLITEYCDKNNMPLPERLELFVTVCRAIQHAHQKGVIHRDIKPSNIMVTLHDGKPVPKVIDFGVAKAINQQLTEKTLFTHYGQMIGTPQYMSPEQAEMSGLGVDTRSDIYSLGVLLYEMLTATTPVTAEQLRATGFAEIQRVIREEEPPTPSTRLSTLGDRLTTIASHRRSDPSKLRQLLHGELDWIVMKSLDKDRARRYETASAFANDIEAYLYDEPVQARPPSVGYLLGKAFRKHRVLVAASAAIAIILLVATVISSWLAVRATFAEDRAEQEAAIARDRADVARKLGKEARDRAKLLSESEKAKSEQLYASDMNFVCQAYADGDVDGMNEKLARHRPTGAEMDQRGFEWYLWWRAGRLNRGALRHHLGSSFWHLDVAPNGDIVAVCAHPNLVYLYSSQEQRLLRSPLRIGSHRDGLCFSPNGDFLIAADVRDGVVRVFDTKNWQLVEELQSPGVNAIAMSQGATPLMSTGGSNQITLWKRTTSGWGVSEELDVNGAVKNLAFTPNGTHLLATIDEHRIVLYDVPRGKIVADLPFQSAVQAISTSSDGVLFAVGQKDGAIRVWRLDAMLADDKARPVTTLSASAPVTSLAFSPAGRRLAAGTDEKNTVVVWDIVPEDNDVSKHNQPITIIHAHSLAVANVAFVKDENTIWSSGVDGYVKTWDLSECQPFDTILGVDPTSPLGFDAKNGQNVLIYADSTGTIQRWNVTARESLEPLDTQARYGHVSLSDDGAVLAGVTLDNELRVWRTDRREMLHTRALGLRNISRLGVNRDGQRVACIVHDRGVYRVVLIDLERDEVIRATDADTAVSADVSANPAFSPDGSHCTIQLRTESYYTTNLFDMTATPFERKYQVGGWGPEYCAVFSFDGTMLAIGSANHNIRLYDAENGKLEQTLKGHSNAPQSLAFSRDGSRLISGGRDGTVRIWRISNGDGSLLSTLRCGDDVKSVVVAPAGNSIASLTGDGTLMIWRSASKEEADDKAVSLGFRAEGELQRKIREATYWAHYHSRRGDWDSAIDHWTTALTLDPRNEYFIERRASAYDRAGKLSDSADDWNQLVQLTGSANGEYLVNRAQCYARMGNREAARADLVKALSLAASQQSIERILLSLAFAKPVVETGSEWRYTTDPPPENWHSNSFEDAHWQSDSAPFRRRSNEFDTEWKQSSDIWLRYTWESSQNVEAHLLLSVFADDNAEIYVNGVRAASTSNTMYLTRTDSQYETMACASQAQLRPGQNVLAVHCHDIGIYAAIDAGLYVQDEKEIETTFHAAVKQAPNNESLQSFLAEGFPRQRH